MKTKQLKVWEGCDEYDYDDPDGMNLCEWIQYVRFGPNKSGKVKGTESLLYAVLQNKSDLVLLHILNGANVNERSSNGWTPLHYAARDRNVSITRILLSCPLIDAHPKTPDGKTPLDILYERRLSITENRPYNMRVNWDDGFIPEKDYMDRSLLNIEENTLGILKLYEQYDAGIYPYFLGDKILMKR